MGTDKYTVKVHHLVKTQDIPTLPPELQEDFDNFFKPILEEDPYDCLNEDDPYNQRKKLRNHLLEREPLIGYYALEIDWCGESYRLVYNISEEHKRVRILAFAAHKPAYHQAAQRVITSTGYKG